jgi:hypothetical protein
MNSGRALLSCFGRVYLKLFSACALRACKKKYIKIIYLFLFLDENWYKPPNNMFL